MLSLLKILLKRKEIKKLKSEIRKISAKKLLKDLDEINSVDLLKHNSIDEMFNEFQNKL